MLLLLLVRRPVLVLVLGLCCCCCCSCSCCCESLRATAMAQTQRPPCICIDMRFSSRSSSVRVHPARDARSFHMSVSMLLRLERAARILSPSINTRMQSLCRTIVITIITVRECNVFLVSVDFRC